MTGGYFKKSEIQKISENYATQVVWIEEIESRYVYVLKDAGLNDTRIMTQQNYRIVHSRLGHNYVD